MQQIRFNLNDERTTKLDAIVEESDAANRAEWLRAEIDAQYADAFGEQDPDEARRDALMDNEDEVVEYSPYFPKSFGLSLEDAKQIVNNEPRPAIDPDHLPAQAPRDAFDKQELLAACYRYYLEDDEAADRLAIAKQVTRTGTSTARKHKTEAEELLGEDADTPTNTAKIAGRSVDDWIDETRASKLTDDDLEAVPESYEQLFRKNLETGREVLERMHDRDTRREEVEELIETIEERHEAVEVDSDLGLEEFRWVDEGGDEAGADGSEGGDEVVVEDEDVGGDEDLSEVDREAKEQSERLKKAKTPSEM